MRALRRAAALASFAAGALVRRRGKNFAVAVALAVVTAAFASVVALTDALRAEAGAEMRAMPDITVARLRGGRPALMRTEDSARIAGIPGVTVVPRVWGYLFVDGLESNLAVVGIAAERVDQSVPRFTSGRVEHAGERGWIVLGDGVMRVLGARVGDGLGLAAPGGSTLDLTVTASFRAESALTTADVALMDERDARTLLGIAPDESTDLAVSLTNPDESRVAARKIGERLPGVRIVERRSLSRAYELTYGTRGGLLALAFIPALLALLVLAWDRATGLSAEERREVAVLKVVGWSTRDVIASRMTEAVLIAVAAGAVGAVTAYAYVFVAQAPGLFRVLLGWSSLFPGFALTPAADGSSLVTLAALTVLPYLAAAVVPAWRAATVDPADVLRAG